MDEKTAIDRCRAGDIEAFRALVEKYQSEAMGHALAILLVRDDAADAVQEAFLKAFRALDRFDSSKRFYPWFYTILRNCCYKIAVRRPDPKARVDESEAENLLDRGSDPGDDRTAQLEAALRRLDPEDREIITLKHLDGASYQELAQRLCIPAGTVMSRLYHARKQLRKQFELLQREES